MLRVTRDPSARAGRGLEHVVTLRHAALAGALVLVAVAAPLGASDPRVEVVLAGSPLAASFALPSGSGLRPPAPDVAPVQSQPADLPRRTTQGTRATRSGTARPSEAVRRGQAALASLDWPWQELFFDVEFAPYRGRFLGLTDAGTRTITVFVRRGQPEGDLRTTIAHELGHALDAVTGTPEMRDAYLRLRGVDPATPWYPCDRCDDLRSPAGDFAETFARWLVGPAYARRTLAPPPDAEQLEALDYFFRPLSERQA